LIQGEVEVHSKVASTETH